MRTPSGLRHAASLAAAVAGIVACGSGNPGEIAVVDSPIVNGTPTSARQVRNVGTIVARAGPTDGWHWFGCSGVLIGSHAFLTAGHCFIGADQMLEYGVTFTPALDLTDPWNPAVPPDATVYGGTVVIHPELSIDDFNFTGAWEDQTYPDLSVIVTNEEVEGIPPARLPQLGYLDRILAFADARDASLEIGLAGYGLTDSTAVIGAGGVPDWGIRRFGTAKLTKVNAQRVFVTVDPSSTCYQDSGAPNFPVGQVGKAPSHVTLTLGAALGAPDAEFFASPYCSDYETTVSMRLDTELALGFLTQFVDPAEASIE